MRALVFALCLVPALATANESEKAAATAAATHALDAIDAAFNAHDAAAYIALLDASYFTCGARITTCEKDAAKVRSGVEETMHRGAALNIQVHRDHLLLDVDEAGNVAWYIADYTFHLPGKDSDRLVRESGTLVKRGREWKVVMMHSAWPLADEPPVAGTLH